MNSNFLTPISSNLPFEDSKIVINQPFFESELFYAFTSIGAFIPGWVLIFPKTHMYNLSDLYSSKDFLAFIHLIRTSVEKLYGKTIMFEHGALYKGATSCGVNHAHLHIIPFEGSIESLVKSEGSYHWKSFNAENIKNKVGFNEYLLCSDANSEDELSGIFTLLDKPISQYFRKILADSINLGVSYDYKKEPFMVESSQTYSLLKEYFER